MKFFEDFDIGDSCVTGGRTITETDIVNYVQVCGLYEQMFINDEHLDQSDTFDRKFAPGELTLSFALGNVARSGFLDSDVVLAGLEVDFLEPVYVGDTIRVESTVVDKRQTSTDERGIVVFEDTIENQRGDVVGKVEKTTLVRTADPGESTPAS